MGILNLFRKQKFFTAEEQERIVQAIRSAEKRTSGEVRVYVESRCRFMDPVDRAIEIFYGLKMEKTNDDNGVLVYVAMKDQQFAVFGGGGIHRRVGEEFWNTEIKKMLKDFHKENYVDGIVAVIHDIGEALHSHFPYEKEDKNELPDDIVFGS